MQPGSVLPVAAAAAAAYLAGAVPFGLVVGRALRGLDIREHGSRNLGATNAWRVLGPRIGVLVLLLDAGKGLVPVLAARALAGEAAAFAAGAAAILGHVFPIYLRFRGGKGVATSAGVLAALAPVETAVAAVAFALALAATRIVSVGSLAAAVALPATAILRDPGTALASRLPITGLALAAAVLVFVRHRANLGRLARGLEPRIGAASGPR